VGDNHDSRRNALGNWPELLSQLTEVNFVKIVDGELLLQPTASSLLNIVVSYFPSEAPTNESV